MRRWIYIKETIKLVYTAVKLICLILYLGHEDMYVLHQRRAKLPHDPSISV